MRFLRTIRYEAVLLLSINVNIILFYKAYGKDCVSIYDTYAVKIIYTVKGIHQTFLPVSQFVVTSPRYVMLNYTCSIEYRGSERLYLYLQWHATSLN